MKNFQLKKKRLQTINQSNIYIYTWSRWDRLLLSIRWTSIKHIHTYILSVTEKKRRFIFNPIRKVDGGWCGVD